MMGEERRASRGEWKGGAARLVLGRTRVLVWKEGVVRVGWWMVVCAVRFGVSKGGGRREERRNLMHVLEEDLDFVQLDQEFVPLLYLVRE